jgi:uncharacterized membrane protein YccC
MTSVSDRAQALDSWIFAQTRVRSESDKAVKDLSNDCRRSGSAKSYAGWAQERKSARGSRRSIEVLSAAVAAAGSRRTCECVIEEEKACRLTERAKASFYETLFSGRALLKKRSQQVSL